MATPGVRGKLIQKIKQDFWKIWSSQYIQILQPKTKWKNQTPNLKIGDIVLIKDDNTSPGEWPLEK